MESNASGFKSVRKADDGVEWDGMGWKYFGRNLWVLVRFFFFWNWKE